MEVRQLHPRDTESLVGASALFDSPPSVEAVQAYLADERNVVFLATEGSKPIGFVRGTALLQIHSPARQMFLYEIGVDERFRRRGVGRALIEAVLGYCRQRRFEEVFVFADPGNEPAVRLYRSTGAATETPADRMFVYRLVPRGAPVS